MGRAVGSPMIESWTDNDLNFGKGTLSTTRNEQAKKFPKASDHSLVREETSRYSSREPFFHKSSTFFN